MIGVVSQQYAVPGPIHQSVLFLVKRNPKLVFELARQFDDQFGHFLQEYEVASNELPDPAAPENVLHADWVIAELIPGSSERAASLAVEVETTFNPLKGYSWLSYAAGVRRLFLCRGWALVFAHDEHVRAKAQNMFVTEPRASPWFVVPEMLPPITDSDQSARDIDRSVLTTVFHARSPLAVACARATLEALFRVAPPYGKIYHALVIAVLKQEQRDLLPKELLQWDDNWELGPMELTGAYYTRGHSDGLEQGLEQGLVRAIEGICELLDITIGAHERAQMQALDADGLDALHTQLRKTRRWPS